MEESSYSSLYRQQHNFFKSGKTRSYEFRRRQLKALKEAVRAHENEIMAALQKDLRKPAAESYMTEIGFLYEEIRYCVKNLRAWMAPRDIPTPLITQPARSVIYNDPLGLTLIIAPWNYPFQLLLSPLVGAIAGGNCAILKPSEETPHTAAIVEKVITAAFPREYVAVVQGAGSEVVPALIDEIPFDHIFFTGSVGVGRRIMAAAAKHLTPVTLELGGKSPCIVDKSADLKLAARRITWGKFLNAGQTCVAPDYLIVHASVKDELVALIREALSQFYGEDPSRSPDYPRMVNLRRFEAITRLLKSGNIVFGGNSDASDLYIAPTLMDNVSLNDPVMQEEIFGPLLPVLTFIEPDEIAEIIAKQPYPLALYVFTNDESIERFVLGNIRFGGGCVNDTVVHLGNPAIPFGGVGTSGFGRYHGRYSFETFTHQKGILKTSTLLDVPLRYPPYDGSPGRLVRMFMR